jgi:N-acetylmuramoyl-L-alanine amidase
VNDFSIGIEIVNPGHEFGYRPFPQIQMEAVAWLAQQIIARYGIVKRNVIGHSDIAPDRKEDPGELFDWEYLAANGVGLWPCDQLAVRSSQSAAGSIKSRLMEYGYPEADESKLITAFQRHFRQRNIGGVWDDECEAILGGFLSVNC